MQDYNYVNLGDVQFPPRENELPVLNAYLEYRDALRTKHLADFTALQSELPPKNLAVYATENRLDYELYLWLLGEIGGNNYANT